MLSLKFIVGGLIAFIALIVGATSLAITLFTSLDTINKVGEAWTLQIAAGVKSLVGETFENSEGHLLAAQPFARSNANKKPIDLANDGQNWTAAWTPFIISQGIKMDYLFSTYSLVFAEDVWWMYSAESRIYRGSQDIEWIETPTPGGTQEVGGIRFWRNNASFIPFDARTNFLPEALFFNVGLALQTDTSFAPITNTLRFRSTQLSDPTQSACFWLPPSHVSGLEQVEIEWDLFGACDIKNTSGHVIGYSLLSLALDKQLRQLLTDSPRSANGNNFIVDAKGFLVATTDEAAFYTSRAATSGSEPPPDGCSNSFLTYPNAPAKMGCRFTPENYGWAPLNAVPKSIYLTETESFATVTSGGEKFIAVGSRFATERGKLSFNIVVVVPVADLLGGVNEGVIAAIGAAVGLIVVAVIIAMIVVFMIARPLEDITKKMEDTADLEGLDKEETLEEDDDDDAKSKSSSDNASPGSPNTPSNIMVNNNGFNASSGKNTSNGGTVANTTNPSWIHEIQVLEAAFVVNHNSLVSFTRYVPKSIVKELIRSGGGSKMKMQPTTVTVSFADIQGFTSICEQVEAKTLSKILNAYFKKMTRTVMVHGGIIEKMIGDCIEGLWNAPFPIARHELLGSLCALAMQREANRNPLKQLFADQGFTLGVRCGAATGTALAGNIGSSQRITYTVLGEPVATANSLEPYNKKWGTMIMIGEDAARECNDELVLRLLTRAKLSGRARPLLCYEVMGVVPDAKVSRKKRGGSDNGSQGSGGGDADSANSGSSGLSDGSLGSSGSYGSSLSDGLDEDAALPSNVDLDKVMLWHQKRTYCDDKAVTFKELFNDAARDVLDYEFGSALKKLDALQQDTTISLAHKKHKSIDTLKEIINEAMKTHGKSGVAGSHGRKEGLLQQEQFYVMGE